jgi:magnesium-transporting ATPase (P-type)
MEQEIIKPQAEPKAGSQAFSRTGSLMAASGATLLMLCFTGSAMVATIWAFAKLIGVPDIIMYVALGLGVIPVLLVTVWTAGRAWHVEKLLAQHKDIDVPVFSITHYFKNG